MEKPIAIFAGSFDPVTNGHLDIIQRAQKLFGSVRVLVMKNGTKKGLFSLQERVNLLREAVADIPQVSVDMAEGLLAEYAWLHQVKILVRAIRRAADVDAELEQAHYNRFFHPEIETVFLAAQDGKQFISSSAVREIVRCGADVSRLVPACVQKALQQKETSPESF